MENSRRDKTGSSSAVAEKKQQPATDAHQDQDDDDEWEEDVDDGDFCTHDITVDLNEPHSRSGQYWKSNFETYHQDAKAEMEKLLKYKQLAKSYAKMKDAEAVEIHERLKEEQAKVGEMEKKLGDMATQIAARRAKGSERESIELMRDLTKQTALAVQYRSQVEELENLLGDKGSDHDAKGRSRRTAASPRGNKQLLESQRELRRVKVQLRDMESIQDEMGRLKSALEAAEYRASKAADGGKRSSRDKDDESSYVKDLLAQLREARAESRKKDDQLKQLADDYESFRNEAVARQEDAKKVLEKTTDKISELKRELRTLRSAKDERGTRPRSFHGTATAAALEDKRNSKDDERPDIHVDLQDLARLTHSNSPSSDLSNKQNGVEKDLDGPRARRSHPSRTLRNKFLEATVEAEVNSVPESPIRDVLADRVNLEPPKWQPYIPRSPRNRAYFMKDIGRRRGHLGGLGEQREAKNTRGLNGAIPRETKGEPDQDDGPQVDLFKDRFRLLGLPDANSSGFVTANNSRVVLPPERRAAALARIEQRKAERRNAGSSLKGRDKENARPVANR